LAGTGDVVWHRASYWKVGLPMVLLLAVSALAVGLIKSRVWARIKGAASGVLLVLLCADSLIAAEKMWASYSHFLVGQHLDAQVAGVLHGKNLYPANGVPPRLFVPGSFVRADSGMKYGFSSVTDYGSLTLVRVWAYLNLAAGLQVDFFQGTFLPDEAYRAGPFPFPGMNIAAGGLGGTLKLFFNAHPGERAYLVHAWRQVPDWTSALQQMVKNHSDPTTVALLEAPAEGPGPAAADTSRDEAVIEAFHRNSIALHVRSSGPALLVVAEAWCPGWQATVNGVPTEVLPANVWMRAVRVPAGENQVELRYVEPSLVRGAGISLCALLVLGAISWRWRQPR
jgi:hypothetical protein